MSMKPFDYLFKLLLMGDSGVGKSSLLFRFSDDAFNSKFISTTGIDFKIKTIELEGKTIKLQIWDTAGQERFKTITKSYYRGAMGIMIVYDVTDSKSFQNIRNWLADIEEHASGEVDKILIGNKCDMENRQITKAQGEDVARQHKMYFLETSAKDDVNVNQAFEHLSKIVLDRIRNQGVAGLTSGTGQRRISPGQNDTPTSQRSNCCSR